MFVPVAVAVPGEGLLERAVVTQETHLQVHLEESELGDLLDLADALADRAHQDLPRILVLFKFGLGECQCAYGLPQFGQLDDVFCSAQAERFKERDQAVLDDSRILDVLLEGDLDPLAEYGGFGKGLDADEGEERANVCKFVLNGRAGETPPRIGVEATAGVVEGCGRSANDMC